MSGNLLLEAFKKTAYPVGGNGKRNLQVLKESLEEMDGNIDSDMYGSGKVIEDFERKMALVLGKETAVFFPSGTMAQQIALRIWCDRSGVSRVAYHPLCHLEIHEQDGLKELHRIEPILLADKDRLIRLDDLRSLTSDDIACLLLELPQREIGGQLPDYQELEAISAFCREQGIKLHLDGARLFEITPYYGKTEAEICALFDSVYVSFYKGIGGIAGAILAGDGDFTAQSKIWKRRHGGDLISLYPYIVSSDYYFERRRPKMAVFYEQAKELAALYNACYGISTLPAVPVSNMFHVHLAQSKDRVETILIEIYEATGIGLTNHLRENGDSACSFETNVGDRYADLPREKVEQAFHMLNRGMQAVT